jgi:hypothetical protein
MHLPSMQKIRLIFGPRRYRKGSNVPRIEVNSNQIQRNTIQTPFELEVMPFLAPE